MLQNIIIYGAVCTYAAMVLTDLFKRYVTDEYTGLVALGFTLIGAFVFDLGIIKALGFDYVNTIPAHYFDLLVTGVVMCKGANAINDIRSKMHGEVIISDLEKVGQ
ncbi:MAG TPA: hypothetical protein DHV55_01495 [Clostridiaceae bacterium]|nr:hypothetical protein [Clostridiaceae bacterium]